MWRRASRWHLEERLRVEDRAVAEERRHGLRRLRLHYHDDPRPYLFKTTDFGKTLDDHHQRLPAWGTTYVIREDPNNERVLYVGTESGLFVSIDGGSHWVRWKSTLPHTAVRSLVVHPRDRELVVGTFGRAIWIGDVSVIEQLESALAQPTFLFEVEAGDRAQHPVR